MRSMRAFCAVAILLGVIVSLTACGAESDVPEMGKVTGKVSLDGSPLSGASVTFLPEKVRASSAITDSDGNYELTYIREVKGAAIGAHKVFISKLINEKETIPGKYSNPEKTTLTAQVKAGDNSYNFDLK